MRVPSISRRARRSRRGFTLLELMIAIGVMAVGVLGFTQALVTALRAQMMARQQTIATEAARRQIEVLRVTDFEDIFRQYNALASDDTGGTGTGPGPNFAVPGLNARADDGDGLPGQVQFPVLASAPGMLREDLDDARFGTPLDLNLDGGVIDANDHSGDYDLLPVVVVVRWSGPAGNGQVQLETILGDN